MSLPLPRRVTRQTWWVAPFGMRGQRPGLSMAAQVARPCPSSLSSTASWPLPTSFSEEPWPLPSHLHLLQGSGLEPVRQGSGDSYKNKSSPAQLPGLQTHLAEIPAGLASGRLAKGSVEQVVVAAAWDRGVIRGGGVSGPNAAAITLCELQQGLTLSELRSSLLDHIWRMGSRIWVHWSSQKKFCPLQGTDLHLSWCTLRFQSQGRHLRTGRKFCMAERLHVWLLQLKWIKRNPSTTSDANYSSWAKSIYVQQCQ